MNKFFTVKIIQLFLCLILLNTKPIFSQFYNYTNYTVEKGFPQSNADFVTQDNEGFMWFATQNGAVKFNGFTYTIYNKNNGLNSNFVIHILQDSKGRFWFSTRNGLTKFEGNTFKTYTTESGLFSNIIYSTFELPDGKILITTTKGTNTFENDTIKKLSEEIRLRKTIKRKNGEIWSLSENDFYSFQNNEFKKIVIDKSIIVPPYNSFIEDQDSNLWIATNNGIFKLSDNDIEHFSRQDGLISNTINNILIDSDNHLWYSSEQTGCGFFKENKYHNMTVESGFSNSVVLSLFEDNEKNIWIGGRNGVTMINTKIPFIHYDQISSFENEIVLGMKTDKDNNLWFTTYGFGLTKFDGKNYTSYTKETGSIDNHFFDIETDESGNFWLASGNSGIIKFDGKTFKQVIPSDNNEIIRRVLTIFKDSKQNLWFGTNGEGVYIYDSKKLYRFGQNIGFNEKDIMSICEDDKQNIWFGTTNNGLFRYNGKEIKKIETDIDLDLIRSIVNRNGVLWIGTGSAGILKITEQNGHYQFKQIQKKDGLNSDNIYLLFADSKGNLWCGSEKGVDKLVFDKNDSLLNIKNYTKDEGFIGVETNINGALEDATGSIWFGTVNGAVKYNEAADKINTTENKTYITGIRLFFEDVDWNEYSDSVDFKNIPKHLILPYNQNHLSFDFIGLCFSNPQKVQYKYRLLGQSDKWSPPGFDQKAMFTNIAPGTYEFQVISANNDNIWNSKPISFVFKIESPYWQKTWFRTLILLLFIILFYFIFDLRLRSLKKAKVNLEIKVSERTSELNLQKSKLEKSNLKITDSINYAEKIQSAMFPSHQIFKKHFSDFFVIFHPRDIVSGDFFWAKEFIYKNEEHVVIVAADCTGHGIPGALVSMLGMSLLNEIIRKEDITSPSQVLEELRIEIKESFKKNDEVDEQTEGIDMVICSYNKATKEFQYSGANNPIYLIRDNQLEVLEPTVNPVGSFIKEIPFQNRSIFLKKDDTIIMFSDGYVDQFNGKTGEKFKIKRFRDLLLSISHFPMKKQKLILDTKYKDWKADAKQIDDILILGLKI